MVIFGSLVDISLGTLFGPLAVIFMQRLYNQYPFLYCVQLILKLLLYHYELNEPFTGGISSYVLQMMIISYIQFHDNDNLTDIILGFLKYYGEEFNFVLTGIDVRDDGRLFSRYKEDCISYDSTPSMYIVDPLNPSHVLGDNALKIRKIKEVFSNVYRKLISTDWQDFFAELDETVNKLVSLKIKQVSSI